VLGVTPGHFIPAWSERNTIEKHCATCQGFPHEPQPNNYSKEEEEEAGSHALLHDEPSCFTGRELLEL